MIIIMEHPVKKMLDDIKKESEDKYESKVAWFKEKNVCPLVDNGITSNVTLI
jgi:hypothetical protein